jgi:hypothetical protein
MTRIGDESLARFDHGRKSAIGTTAVQLTTTSTHAPRGVQIKAAVGNSGVVYVGNSDVTAGARTRPTGFRSARAMRCSCRSTIRAKFGSSARWRGRSCITSLCEIRMGFGIRDSGFGGRNNAFDRVFDQVCEISHLKFQI